LIYPDELEIKDTMHRIWQICFILVSRYFT
jgi:hypothetical protein